jgi:AraC family transcriptional regulator, regulatory protein of adaptative response / methylated-DNA-[protein]-cysteine methyltransferase
MDTKDYVRIESALRYLAERTEQQPTLADVAGHVGLSEHHLQRVFTRWAGISPKRFLQFQTVENAKSLLRESRSVLDTTYSTGLSSVGRLHDLFVTLEAVTPGEYKSGGAGLNITRGFHDSPFGQCLVAITDRGICGLSFVVDGTGADALAELEARWPGATFVDDTRATEGVVRQIFGGLANDAWTADGASDAPDHRVPASLSVLVRGTNFQVRVWEALLRIPPGTVRTYEDIAGSVGQSGATRAVGAAIGRNPVAFLIPCHRVIRKTGAFGGYHWGMERKIAMLMRETAPDASRRRAEDALALAAS